MSSTNYIQSYCQIKNGTFILNGKSIPFLKSDSINDLLKSIYVEQEIDYPKFYKMDDLCKLGFIAAEFVLKGFSTIQGERTAIILANASSTLKTDLKHQNSIEDNNNYFPSPSTFVYTLPNITIGEIAIRHKFKGENTFFVSEQYDTSFMCQYINSILNNNRADFVLTGWIEVLQEDYNCFISLVGKEKTGFSTLFNKETIDILYK